MSTLLGLVQRLHKERLFIKHEQDTIWKLNEQVQHHAEQLSHLFWITRQHYVNLNKLIINSAQETPSSCCRRSNSLESVQFVDAYKEFGYRESMYSQFLEVFINNPTLAAACLAYGDKLGLEATSDIVHIIVLGCYGNSIMSDDHKHLLELMESLVLLQLASEEQPRRVIQKDNCAFNIAFKLFTESLLDGKLFLTSALCQPIMEVLMDDELYLETSEQKILTQLNKFEVEQRFGKKDSLQMKEKIKLHTKKAEEKLSSICSFFIDSLLSSMCCFPPTLGWIIARTYFIIKDAGFVTHEEARALCSDFFLQQFVCPAIVNPELYGVTGDIPVGPFSRFNLMQIAQVLQVMAHSDGSSLKPENLYSSSNKEKMWQLIETVINSCSSNEAPPSHSTPHGYINSTVFFTSYQLSQLIKFLQDIQKSGVRGVDQSTLSTILSHLPTHPPSCMEHFANVLSTQSSVVEEEGVGAVRQGSMNDMGETVLVISISPSVASSPDLPGTLSEQEVMELHAAQTIAASASNLAVDSGSIDARSLPETEGLDKRSRFSLYSGGSDLSEIDHELPTEDGISRTSGSSSIDIDHAETVPVDDASSFHAGNADEDEEEGGDLESVTHANNDEALKALRRKLPSSRESIEDKMRKFEIRQELGVRFADPGVTGGLHRDEGGQTNVTAPVDARSDTWSMDVYASDSEPQTEQQSDRLHEIAEDPAQHIRNASSNVGSFLVLTRDDDSRSDVWSVEVLPSDSEPPDVRSEDRLRELDSDGGNPSQDDTVEDNRSRASTPGLSAVSGFSAVSGLSLVSENNQVKGCDEPWIGPDRSKEAGSDADDIRHSGQRGGRSDRHKCSFSNTDKKGSVINSKLWQQLNSGTPTTEANPHKETLDVAKLSVSFDENSQSADSSPCIFKVAVSDKVVDISSEEEPTNALDFNENINTIKRSPFKHNEDKHAHRIGDTMQSNKLISWDESQSSSSSVAKNFEQSIVSGDSISHSLNPSHSNFDSAAAVSPHVLQDFDPLLKSMESQLANYSEAADATLKAKEGQESSKSTSQEIDENETVQPRGRIGNNSPEFMERSQRKGVDRKKSWWKNNRLSTFAKKKVSNKANGLGGGDSGSAAEGSRQPNRTTSSLIVSSDDSLSSSKNGALIEFQGLSASEDIMQKYMKKVSVNHRAVNNSKNDASLSLNHLNANLSVSKNVNASMQKSTTCAISASTNTDSPSVLVDTSSSQTVISSAPSITSWNHTAPSAATVLCPLDTHDSSEKFNQDLKDDAKRKLRIVLAMTESIPEPFSSAALLPSSSSEESTKSSRSEQIRLRDQLLSFLHTEHARALLLQNYSHVAQLHETIRCVEALDQDACRHVVKSLWKEYKLRSTYVAYLVRARQHLLNTLSYLQHITERTDRDKLICRQYFTAQCVKLFLKDKEIALAMFRSNLARSITLDEKVQLIKDFLSSLYGQMVESQIWEGASQDQIEDGEIRIERYIFSCVYKQAMFPNGDGDILRDQLYHQHILRLAAVITPSHPSLLVRKKYLLECPWPSAQREASALAAYRSPRGKLQAALRCCRAVMHLLKLADENQAPGADDFTPVLVFVLIKANPPHLLSTVQFVNSFMGEGLTGEDAYWWMQFTAATEFIKTIDERK